MGKTTKSEIKDVLDFITEFLPKKTNIEYSIVRTWKGIDNMDGSEFYGIKFDVDENISVTEFSNFYKMIFELVNFWDSNSRKDIYRFLNISCKNRPLSEQNYYF